VEAFGAGVFGAAVTRLQPSGRMGHGAANGIALGARLHKLWAHGIDTNLACRARSARGVAVTRICGGVVATVVVGVAGGAEIVFHCE
jgi:hypothetical protein